MKNENRVNRVWAVGNETYRDFWVTKQIRLAADKLPSGELLDVGAGLSPYKSVAETAGLSYKSHDFSNYMPSSASEGLQTKSWDYPEHNFVCDILEIPPVASAEIIICTEVLEHVPDPVRAFQHCSNLLKPDGLIIVTVPFLSLMHQAPFWFQSGLSPFWFKEWCEANNLEIVELTIQGDYIDLMSQEAVRLFSFSHRTKFIGNFLSKLIQKLRPRIPQSTLESGGLGTLLVARKIV